MIEYDEIGRIADQPGEYDEDGVETKPPTFLSGWFINATELDPVMAEFQISPSNPVRVFPALRPCTCGLKMKLSGLVFGTACCRTDQLRSQHVQVLWA